MHPLKTEAVTRGRPSDAGASSATKPPKVIVAAVSGRRPTLEERRRFDSALRAFLSELVRQELRGEQKGKDHG